MADSSTQSIVIAAPAERVAEVVADFGSYPEWADAFKQSRSSRSTRTAMPARSGS